MGNGGKLAQKVRAKQDTTRTTWYAAKPFVPQQARRIKKERGYSIKPLAPKPKRGR